MQEATNRIISSSIFVRAAMALAAAIFALTLTACASSSGGEQVAVESGVSDSAGHQSQGGENGSVASQDSSEGGLSVKSQGGMAAFDDSGTIDQSVLVDNEVLTVEAQELVYKNNIASLKLRITNNSSEGIEVLAGTLGFSANYVNDYMTVGYLNCNVAAGESVEDSFDISLDELRLMGICGIGEIGIGLRVQPSNEGKESDDYSFDELYRGIARVETSLFGNPSVADDSYAAAMESASNGFTQLGGKVLKFTREEAFQQGGISIGSIAVVENAEGDRFGLVEFENETNKIVSIQYGKVNLNGVLAYEGLWNATTIAPGKKSICTIEFKRMLDYVKENNPDGSSDLNEVESGDISSFGMAMYAVDENQNTLFEEAVVEYSM